MLLELTLLAQARIGDSPKTASPEIVKQMQEEVKPASSKQASVLKKGNDTLNNKVNLLLAQISILSNELSKVKLEVASKDYSRVSIVETRLNQYDSEKKALADKVKEDHDALMAWVHPIFGACVATLFGIGVSIWKSSTREKRVSTKLNEIREQTNGLSNNLAIVTGQKEYIKGKAEGFREATTDILKQERQEIIDRGRVKYDT